MSTRHPLVRVHTWALVGCLAGGCSSAALAQDAGAASFGELLLHRKLAVYPGSIDSGDRYRATLKVIAPGVVGNDQPGRCSANLIAPRLALTAAHCVCRKQKILRQNLNDLRRATGTAAGHNPTGTTSIKKLDTIAIIEPSTCVKNASVHAVLHDSRETPDYTYQGTVRAHPECQILFDGEMIVRNHADLAVIELDRPVNDKLLPVYELPDSEVEPGDRITFAGYGEEPKKFDYGERRFGDNEISWITTVGTGNAEFVAGARTLADGGVVSHIYYGDSGGGCFKANDNKVLVGVISSYAEDADGNVYSVITSVFANRLWLKREMVRARVQLPPGPPLASHGTRDGGAAVLPAAWQVNLPADAGSAPSHPPAIR